jgi:hypothetical protein
MVTPIRGRFSLQSWMLPLICWAVAAMGRGVAVSRMRVFFINGCMFVCFFDGAKLGWLGSVGNPCLLVNSWALPPFYRGVLMNN